MADDLYETYFYTWTERQGQLLRSGHVAQADLFNIAEEIETLGRSEAAALRSAYRLIAMHLLKMWYQPKKMSNSWRVTIVRERGNVVDLLKQSPGLKPRRQAIFEEAYGKARDEAAAETELPIKTFPDAPPFDLEKVEARDYYPQSFHRWQAKKERIVTRHTGAGIDE